VSFLTVSDLQFPTDKHIRKEIVDANVMFFNSYRARSSPEGRLPLFQILPEHNHLSNVLSIGTEDDVQAKIILDFVQKVCR